jgi:hypothetical protein
MIDEARRRELAADERLTAAARESYLPPDEQERLRAERQLEAELAELERQFVVAGGDPEDFARRRAAIKSELILGRAQTRAARARQAQAAWLHEHF